MMAMAFFLLTLCIGHTKLFNLGCHMKQSSFEITAY